jgi:hypothetical protein
MTRLTRYLKSELWRPDDPRVHVRKRRPGYGWTVNLAAVARKLRRR